MFHYLNAVLLADLLALKEGGNASNADALEDEIDNAVHYPLMVVHETLTQLLYILAILNAWAEVGHDACKNKFKEKILLKQRT